MQNNIHKFGIITTAKYNEIRKLYLQGEITEKQWREFVDEKTRQFWEMEENKQILRRMRNR